MRLICVSVFFRCPKFYIKTASQVACGRQKIFKRRKVNSESVMKFLILFSAVIVIVLGSPLEEDFFLNPQNLSRVAGGVAPKSNEYPDFCYINVDFISKCVLCGAVIVPSQNQYLLTSARCVAE